jgi:hypothetical protein
MIAVRNDGRPCTTHPRRNCAALRLTLVLATCLAGRMLSVAAVADESANELSRQATDPTASLMSFGLIGGYTGDFYGNQGDQTRTEIKFQPVIPFRAFDTSNILRISMPYQLNGPGKDGLSAVAVFDLVVISESWGRWGIGPVMSFATNDNAPDSFSAGPAIGGVWQYSKKLNLGLFNQNLLAGHTGVSQLQPIVAYQLGDGWSLSAGDLQFAYDWKNGRWISAPIGFQVGKVTKLAGQAVRWAINPQYNLVNDTGLEKWKILFTFTLLVPSK